MNIHRFFKSLGQVQTWMCMSIVCLVPATSIAAELKLLAVSESEEIRRIDRKLRLVSLAKAMVYVDGNRHVLAEGETSPEGVTLVSVVDSDQVVVESNGQRDTLNLGAATVFPGTPDSDPTEDQVATMLWADPQGFFYVDGVINGYPVRFLVDTGATIIALDAKLAKRIGLNYSSGLKGVAQTVGGTTPMVSTKLSEVSVGDITLRDVDAAVMVDSNLDVPLLGMSFLGQVDMIRTANQMELKQRY